MKKLIALLLCAVLLGPYYGVGAAFVASLLPPPSPISTVRRRSPATT